MVLVANNITDLNNLSQLDALRDKRAISHDDATWILTSAFIIFTMQSGKRLYFKPFIQSGL